MSKMSTPLVSIIIPTYNRRGWIGECLDSVKEQTYPHIETLVIDDCSTDGTVEWLRESPNYTFAQVHVQLQNGGASVARNTGIRIARGDLQPIHLREGDHERSELRRIHR